MKTFLLLLIFLFFSPLVYDVFKLFRAKKILIIGARGNKEFLTDFCSRYNIKLLKKERDDYNCAYTILDESSEIYFKNKKEYIKFLCINIHRKRAGKAHLILGVDFRDPEYNET